MGCDCFYASLLRIALGLAFFLSYPHHMYVRKVKRPNGIVSVRIVEGHRLPSGKVQQKLLKIVGQGKLGFEVLALEQAANEIIAAMKAQKNPQSKGGRQLSPTILLKDVQEIQRVNDGIFEVFGKIYNELGLNKVIETAFVSEKWNDILKALVLCRISHPTSKRKTAQILSKDYFADWPLEQFYKTMDLAEKRSNEVCQLILSETSRLHGGEINVALFDVTTLYFESSTDDELKDFGFSKDCKFKDVQVVLSLMTTKSGLPLGYKLFPGNTAECKTLLAHISSLKKDFSLKEVTLIADRAMFSDANLAEMESLHMKYIVACKLRSLTKTMQTDITSRKKMKKAKIAEEDGSVSEYEYNGRRLVVGYSFKRAQRDAHQRQRLVDRLIKKAHDGKIKIKELINNHGTKKYIKITKDASEVEIDLQKMSSDAAWDGLHGIITNDKKSSSSTLLSSYRQLWRIEEAFRINKTDLKMRPIYHWKPRRVRAHILICYMAFAITKFVMERLNEGLEKKMSLQACVEELSRVESSILKNTQDGSLYVFPSFLTAEQREIYNIMGVSRRDAPQFI